MSNLALREKPMTPEEIALLKDTLVRGLTDQQFEVFMNIARGLELNPFRKEIYGMVLQGRLVTIVGIDGFRKIAHRTGAYAGMDSINVEYAGNEEVLAASATVYRFVQGEKVSFNARVLFKEYTTGKNNWKTKPHTMLCKVAESHALRRGFPELGGVYTPEEMEQVNEVGPSDRTREINARLDNMEVPETPEYDTDVINAPKEEDENVS